MIERNEDSGGGECHELGLGAYNEARLSEVGGRSFPIHMAREPGAEIVSAGLQIGMVLKIDIKMCFVKPWCLAVLRKRSIILVVVLYNGHASTAVPAFHPELSASMQKKYVKEDELEMERALIDPFGGEVTIITCCPHYYVNVKQLSNVKFHIVIVAFAV